MAVKAIKPSASIAEIRRVYASASQEELEQFKTNIQEEIDELKSKQAALESIAQDQLVNAQAAAMIDALPEPYATEMRNAMVRASAAVADGGSESVSAKVEVGD